MNSQKGKEFVVQKELLKGNETSKSKEGTTNAFKEPLRKSGTHSGLKFNFNLKKDVALKTINFEEKGNVSIVPKQTVASQNKEACTGSACTDDRIKTLRVKVVVNNAQAVKNLEDSTILTKKKETELCSNIPKLLKDLQPSQQTSKVLKPQPSITLKHESASSSKIQTLNVPDYRKVYKGQPTERKEISKSATGRNTEVTHKKFGSHSGLKFKLSVNKSSFTSVEQYGFTSKVSRSNSSKSDMNPQQTKDQTSLARGNVRK